MAPLLRLHRSYEGEAKRWNAARLGEFRVDADGRALMSGMADAELEPIGR